MKLSLIALFILFFTNMTRAQEWSMPIQISSDTLSAFYPDICIDNFGVLHSVWTEKINDNFYKIYYSKSQDRGTTWSQPEDVLQNTGLWMANPHIAADANNNLYLTFDYNSYYPENTYVHFCVNNGNGWSQPYTVSTDMPGSNHNRIVIDNNNRIYVFWFKNNKIYYRYFENNNWGEIICPYNNDNELYFLSKATSDKFNNIHCIGVHHFEGQSGYDDRIIYFKYDNTFETWNNIEAMSDNRSWQGCDIDLDNNQLPHLAWGQFTSVYPDPAHDATFYTRFDGINWIPTELIVEDPYYQSIAVDSYNRPHIIDKEKTENGNRLVYYVKHNENWEGVIIDSSYSFFDPKLIFGDSTLFFIYEKLDVGGGKGKILFSKYNVPVGIHENSIKTLYSDVLNQNFPNPFNLATIINFYLNHGGYSTLKILDLQGKLVKMLVNGPKLAGDYQIYWDGTNQAGIPVPNGLYLYRLQVGNRTMTKSLVIKRN